MKWKDYKVCTVALTPEVRKKLENVASKQHRTLTGQVRYYIENGLTIDEKAEQEPCRD